MSMDTSMDGLPARPRPTPTEESQGYWDALSAHRLCFQQCADCGRLRHYPRPMCDACWSMRSTWFESAGLGTVVSWTVAHHPFHLAFKRQAPYALVTVELEDGVRMHAPWRGAVESLRLDLPVRVVFEDVEDGLTLPAFVAAA
jgi:uncharacterized OB-fold protein